MAGGCSAWRSPPTASITAIVGRRGDVHLVRAGDQLPGDLTVTEVAEAGVQLRRADGSAIELRLP